ncbi:YdbL family protein [Pseudoblastomonas halimionae]|uniref:DUF1318 domain-containing protein n=1 Tax=Alteriqipengyuania halimionae TaxID=1926630 RepID=A0A6I4U145_9SPHN|nr:YdbL family protein [Alteriqipengyuania halimionae]MXP09769.1 DUF1318 domain-containing protein [Alteriqipengyuania halimionae]
MIRKTLITAAAIGSMMAIGGTAQAMQDRDPAYEAARASGKVGEKVDGYLGIVGQSTPELERIVADINMRRRAVYTQRARAEQATINEYAIAAGCKLILRTSPGEKYQAPDGSWQTRTQDRPVLLPQCPKN